MAKRPATPTFSPAVKDDPVEFSRLLLKNPDDSPLTLHDKQAELLHSIKPLSVFCCGRQFGKSVGMGVDCTWFSVTHANRQVYIIAPTLDQSRIIFNEVARHFRTAPLSALVVGKIVEYPFPRIRLLNGTEIHARGANSPQFIRGHPAHRIYLDEAAFFKEEVIGGTIEPMLNVAGKAPDSALVMISTPFGMGEFYDYAQDAQDNDDPNWAAFKRYTSMDNPHHDPRRLERTKARYGEDSLIWRTEYLAEFVDDALSIFPWQDIKWAYENYPYKDPETGDPIFPQPAIAGHQYAQGVDLANKNDYFVASVGDITNPGLIIRVRHDRLTRAGWDTYKNIVRTNYAAYNRAETLIDATSLAESVVEDLRDINAEGYKFTGTTAKQEVVYELKRLLAEHRFVFPYDRDTIDEYRLFQYKVTPSKNYRMEAKTGHDDIVMADALLAHVALLPRNLGFFQGVDGWDQVRDASMGFPNGRPPSPAPSPHVPGSSSDPWAALFSEDW
jgi:hypothetical protein